MQVEQPGSCLWWAVVTGHFRTSGWQGDRCTNDRNESRAALHQRPLENAHPSKLTCKDRRRLSKAFVALLTDIGHRAAVNQHASTA